MYDEVMDKCTVSPFFWSRHVYHYQIFQLTACSLHVQQYWDFFTKVQIEQANTKVLQIPFDKPFIRYRL